MPIESVMQSSHLILCHPLLLLPPVPPSIRVFSNESTLLMRWPKYWSFSFSISPSNEHPGLISFRMVIQPQISTVPRLVTPPAECPTAETFPLSEMLSDAYTHRSQARPLPQATGVLHQGLRSGAQNPGHLQSWMSPFVSVAQSPWYHWQASWFPIRQRCPLL